MFKVGDVVRIKSDFRVYSPMSDNLLSLYVMAEKEVGEIVSIPGLCFAVVRFPSNDLGVPFGLLVREEKSND